MNNFYYRYRQVKIAVTINRCRQSMKFRSLVGRATMFGELYFRNLSAFFGCTVYQKKICSALAEVFRMFIMIASVGMQKKRLQRKKIIVS